MNAHEKEFRSFPDDPRYKICRDGLVIGASGRPLKPRPNQQGYMRISHVVSGKTRDFYVHRAVCAAFNGPPPSTGHQVDHINSDRKDNRAENLRWVLREENLAHRNICSGLNHHGSKLTIDEVRRIKRGPHFRGFDRQMAEELGVSRETVRDIRNGKQLRDVQ